MELDPGLLLPAMVAGVLIIATHVPLGREVLKRGIIFIDLAVAQIAVLGVIIAQNMQWSDSVPGTQLAAFGSALLGSYILYHCERRWPQVQEAIIGTAFVLAAATALLLLSRSPRGGEQFQELLSGQILWVSWEQLAYIAVLYATVLFAWVKMAKYRTQAFYLLFALTVTGSVQLVGVLLVFASLVIPALLVRKLEGSKALMWAYGHAVLSYFSGFVASTMFDLPTGPTIVWILVVFAIVAGRLLKKMY